MARPSADWRTYRRVDCGGCATLHPTAPARLADGQWEIDCPTCGVRRWGALISAEMRYWSGAPQEAIPHIIRLLREMPHACAALAAAAAQ